MPSKEQIIVKDCIFRTDNFRFTQQCKDNYGFYTILIHMKAVIFYILLWEVSCVWVGRSNVLFAAEQESLKQLRLDLKRLINIRDLSIFFRWHILQLHA
jgi:hypothetical protein